MDQSMCIQTGKRARSSDDPTENLHPSKRRNSQHVGSLSMYQGDLFPAENSGLPLDYGHIGTNLQGIDPFLLHDGTTGDFLVDDGLWDYAADPTLPLTTDHLLWSDPLDLPMNGTEQNDMRLDLALAPNHQEAREICFGMVNKFVALFLKTTADSAYTRYTGCKPEPRLSKEIRTNSHNLLLHHLLRPYSSRFLIRKEK